MKIENKKIKYILAVLVGLQLLVMGLMFYKYKGGKIGGGSGNSSSYLPIWVAVMVPFIVNKRKKKKTSEEEKRWWCFILR